MPRESIKYTESIYLDIEKKYKVTLPSEFHLMWKQGWMSLDFPVNAELFSIPGRNYMWMRDMEWFPLEEILSHEFPDYGAPYLPALIPFAHSGAGDTWCFQADHDMRVLFCPHDCDSGEIFAPNFPSGLLLSTLEYVSGAEDSPEETAKMLQRWATDLKLVWPEKWSDLLIEISRRPSITVEVLGEPRQSLLSLAEKQEIVQREIHYPDLGAQIHWMSLDK